MEIGPPGDQAVGGGDAVAAEIAAVAGVERLVEVADEMDDEGQEREQDRSRTGSARSASNRRLRSIWAETQLPSRQAEAWSNGWQTLTF